MLVQDIITRVRNIAGDINVLQFTDDQVIAWINDGIRECAVNNNLLQKRGSIDTVAGTNEYSLPTDVLKLHSLTYNDSKLDVMTLQEWEATHGGDASSQGTPSIAYVWAGKIVLSPTPESVGTLAINYIYDPTDVSNNTDAISLPVGYHTRLVDYCLAQVAQQDGDTNMYTLKMQEFATGVQSLKDQLEYENDLYPHMSVSPRDMGYDYEGGY